MNGPDPALLAIFAGEQAEHVERMRALLVTIAGAPPEPAQIEELFRRAHTLKGAARAVGIEATEQIVHRMESVFALCRQTATTPSIHAVRTLEHALDCVEDVLAWMTGKRTEPQWSSVLRSLDALSGQPEDTEFVSDEAPAASGEVAHAAATSNELVRVDAATLDALVRASSQLVTIASGDPAAVRESEELSNEIAETLREYQRLRSQCAPWLRKRRSDIDAAPLAECLDFVDKRLGRLMTLARVASIAREQSVWRMRRTVEELHDYAAMARMTPAEAYLGGFGPMVRGLAAQEGKEVIFRSEGLDVQADRLVLQALKDPVMHVLRNAVSHGIERPDLRQTAGKERAGTVRLHVRSRGDRLNITVEDDGAGLNTAAFAREAARHGMPVPETGTDELTRLAFTPGFSTAATVSSLSGRGMGLAVVGEAVHRLRGAVSLGQRPSGGAVVRISVPLSIATEHVLLVREGDDTFALPSSTVEAVLRKTPEEITVVDGRECVVIASEAAPLVRLSELLGLDAMAEPGAAESLHVVIVGTESGRAAIAVGEVLNDREAIVRDTGLTTAGFTAGAVPLEDNAVAAMLNLSDVLQRFVESGRGKKEFRKPPQEHRKRRIMVVDDSVTTRSLERNILEAHGYDVELAVDGIEALDKIRAGAPDLVISDVTMPRMDGFQLLEKLKTSKETAEIPVILVTSLETPEEQERGLSLGADAYIVKRKFDQRELLAVVRQIL